MDVFEMHAWAIKRSTKGTYTVTKKLNVKYLSNYIIYSSSSFCAIAMHV